MSVHHRNLHTGPDHTRTHVCQLTDRRVRNCISYGRTGRVPLPLSHLHSLYANWPHGTPDHVLQPTARYTVLYISASRAVHLIIYISQPRGTPHHIYQPAARYTLLYTLTARAVHTTIYINQPRCTAYTGWQTPRGTSDSTGPTPLGSLFRTLLHFILACRCTSTAAECHAKSNKLVEISAIHPSRQISRLAKGKLTPFPHLLLAGTTYPGHKSHSNHVSQNIISSHNSPKVSAGIPMSPGPPATTRTSYPDRSGAPFLPLCLFKMRNKWLITIYNTYIHCTDIYR